MLQEFQLQRERRPPPSAACAARAARCARAPLRSRRASRFALHRRDIDRRLPCRARRSEGSGRRPAARRRSRARARRRCGRRPRRIALVGSRPSQPNERAAPDGDPGVRGVGAGEARLARRRDGADVAADIERRQAEAAQAGDHHMGEILADAAPRGESLRRARSSLRSPWRRRRNRALMRAFSSTRGLVDRPARGEALARIVGRGGETAAPAGSDRARRRGCRAASDSVAAASAATLSHGGVSAGDRRRRARDLDARTST